MNPLDRIVEDVAALRKKVDAERTTLRLGSVQPSGTVALPDGGQVTPASSVGALTTGDRVLVAQHNRRAYVIGTAGPTGSYNPHLNLYVPSGTSLAGWRNRVHAARAGRSTTVAVIGSSSVAGYGAATIPQGWAWLLKDRFADAGYPIQGTGLRHLGAANLASDPRWTFSGTISNPSTIDAALNAGAWAQHVTDVAGQRVRVWFYNDRGSFTVTIDGGSPTTVTPSGAASVGSWTSGVLSNTTHTVRVTGVGSSPTARIVAVESYSDSAPGINVTVAGVGASTSALWSTWLYTSAMPNALRRAAALTIVAVNGNDFSLDVPRETTRTRFTSMVNGLRILASEPLFVLMPHVQAQDLDAYRSHASVLYDVADRTGVAVIDMQQRWGSYALADGADLFADGVHPSTRGHEMYADAVFNVIGA